MQKIKENGISHPVLFSAHYINEIYFVCLFIYCLFFTCPLCFWAASISQKMVGGGEFKEIRMMSLSLCLI
jgi:hypothetical protein